MTRKTLIGLFLGAVMLCTGASGMTVTLTDMEQNQLKITNADSDVTKVKSGDLVKATIVKPGTDAANLNAEQIVYTHSQRSVNNAYSFDVTMPEDSEGVYTFIVTYGGNKESITQNFYSYDAKKVMATKLSTDTITTELIQNAMNTFSLENYQPYMEMGTTKDAQMTTKMTTVVDEYQKYGANFKENADKAYELLVFAAATAALEADCACMTNTDGSVKENYAETIGFANNALYGEYPTSLSTTGLATVKAALQNANIASTEQADIAFENAMLLNLITKNAKDGNGHVGTLLNIYQEKYTGKGFALSLLSNVKNLSNVYDGLKSSTASTIYAMATEFPNYVANADNSESGGTPGGTIGSGGGGGTGGAAGGGIDNIDYSRPSVIETFADLDSVPWASDAIKILADKGVIAGKGNNLFAPNDNVTRQEFVKILVGTFGFTAEDTTCYFADVTADWAKPYVAIANALGIVNGTSAATFSPDALITREDGAVMLARAAAVLGNALEPGGNAFADDAQIAAYAKDGVYGLVNAGIVSGKGNNIFDPKASMTRAEAAKMIYGLSIR